MLNQRESRGEGGRYPIPSAHHHVDRHFIAGEALATAAASEEVLVGDPRGALTPVQMVDQKLHALLEANRRDCRHGNRLGARPPEGPGESGRTLHLFRDAEARMGRDG